MRRHKWGRSALRLRMLALKSLNALVDGIEEAIVTNFTGQAGSPEQFSQGRIGVRDLENNSLLAQFAAEVAERLDGGHVNVGDGLGVQEKPLHWRRRRADDVPHPLGEIVAIGKQKRRVKTISNQSRNGGSIERTARVVEAMAGYLAQNGIGRVRNAIDES